MQPSTVTSTSKGDMKNVLQVPKDLVMKDEIQTDPFSSSKWIKNSLAS